MELRPRVLPPMSAPRPRKLRAEEPHPRHPRVGRLGDGAAINGGNGSRATGPMSRPRRSLGGWRRHKGSTSAASRPRASAARSPKRTCSTAATAPGNGASAAPTAGEEKQLRGPAAMLAKAMDESRAVPTATSFRTIAVDTLDAKRRAINAQLKERGLKTSFTHLVAWAIVEAAKRDPGDGPQLRGARRQTLRDRERPGQPRHRRRRDQERRLAQPHGPGDQGRPGPRLRGLPLEPSKS